MKKVFENAVWWSGVVMVGLILGTSIQFVKAWTEPAVAPPGGNVGAPINTSSVTQIKNGILSLVGLSTSYINVPGVVPVAGNVLTAQNASGQVAWAAGSGGGIYVEWGNNTCTEGAIIYSGVATYPQLSASIGPGGVFCLKGNVRTTLGGTSSVSTNWSDGKNVLGGSVQVPCAVCKL